MISSFSFQASQDLGMVLGNIVAWSFLYYSRDSEQEETILKTFFYENESGEWVCGSQSNPYRVPTNNYRNSFFFLIFNKKLLGSLLKKILF